MLQLLKDKSRVARLDANRSPLHYYQNVKIQDAGMLQVIKERRLGYADGIDELETLLNAMQEVFIEKVKESEAAQEELRQATQQQ